MHGTKWMNQQGRSRWPLAATIVFAMALAGCEGGGSTTATLGAQGGTVSLTSGLTLDVPRGALSNSVAVTLRETTSDGYADIQVDPAALALGAAAVLSWSGDDDATLESDDDGDLLVERDGGRARAHLRHFGHFRRWHHCRADAGLDGGACTRRSRDCVDGGACVHPKGGCTDGGSACGGRDGGEGHGGGCSGGEHGDHDDHCDHDDHDDHGDVCEGDGHHCGRDGGCSHGHGSRDGGAAADAGEPVVP